MVKRHLFSAFLVLLSLAASAAADPFLGVDFQHGSIGSVGQTQNGFQPFQNMGGDSSSDSFLFSTSAGDVNVTIGSKDTLIDGMFTRGGLTNNAGFTYANIYNDFAFQNFSSFADPTGSTDLTLSLSGPAIQANEQYELTFYSFDPGEGLNQGSHVLTISGEAGTTGDPLSIAWVSNVVPLSNDQYSATGIFRADGTGTLNFSLVDVFTGAETATGIRLNAFQISAVASNAVPEPVSLAMWSVLGSLALVGVQLRCRRLRRMATS